MIFRKIKHLVAVGLLLLINVCAAFAQGCDAAPPTGEPDDGGVSYSCPIDTWVYVLAFAALIFGAYQLHKKDQKTSDLA